MRIALLFGLLYVLLLAVITGLSGDKAGAVLTSTGPTDLNTLYALEYSNTTDARSINVPVYLRTQPSGNTTINLSNYKQGTSGIHLRACRGNSCLSSTVLKDNINSSPDSFNIPASAFSLDASSNMWRANIFIEMRNYGEGSPQDNKYIHFRLSINGVNAPNGYIAYGGMSPTDGVFSAAAREFPGSPNHGLPVRNYSLHMATPCDITSNTIRNLFIYDLDHRNPDNLNGPVTVEIYDLTDNIRIVREHGDDYSGNPNIPRDHPMGQDGELRIGMTFKPGHRYRVDIRNISANNVVEYNFPFDNIASIIDCADLVDWQASAFSNIRRAGSPNGPWQSSLTVSPGQYVTFRHGIRNNGPSATTRTVTGTPQAYGARNTLTPGQGPFTLPNNTAADGQVTQLNTNPSWIPVTQDMVGVGEICQRVRVTPTGPTGNNATTSSGACFTVPYQYSLTPTISVGQNVVEPGGTVNVTGRVTNNGPTNSRGGSDTRWRVFAFQLAEGVTPPSGGTANVAPCTHIGTLAGASNCGAIGTQQNGVINANSTVTVNPSHTVPDTLPAGTQLCFMTWVAARDQATNNNQWRYSRAECAKVGKQPKLQVLGGDVRSIQGTIQTSTTNRGGNYYGSWAEYGVFAARSNQTMASGGGLFTPSSVSTTDLSRHALTFRNTPDLGNFVGLPTEGIVDQFRGMTATRTTTGHINISSGGVVTGNNTIIDATSSGSVINITASNDIPLGRTIIIRADRTVSINSDIAYSDAAINDLGQIPQVVIIAPSISIHRDYDRVDAWLIATNETTTGTLRTCNVGDATGLHIGICNNPVTITGPVIADQVRLARTAGSGTLIEEAGDPAEIINMRADAYLWLHQYFNTVDRALTTHTTELSPRF